MDNYEVALTGVKIVAEILDFSAPDIFIIEKGNLPNKEITGLYRFEQDEIIFNENWILQSDWTEVIITAFHEMRHAYQGYCIRTKSRESEETLNRWQHDINNYIMPSGKNNELDDIDYLSQEIEIDAIAFTHKMMLEYFDLKTFTPDKIKKNVMDKVRILYQIREVIL